MRSRRRRLLSLKLSHSFLPLMLRANWRHLCFCSPIKRFRTVSLISNWRYLSFFYAKHNKKEKESVMENVKKKNLSVKKTEMLRYFTIHFFIWVFVEYFSSYFTQTMSFILGNKSQLFIGWIWSGKITLFSVTWWTIVHTFQSVWASFSCPLTHRSLN